MSLNVYEPVSAGKPVKVESLPYGSITSFNVSDFNTGIVGYATAGSKLFIDVTVKNTGQTAGDYLVEIWHENKLGGAVKVGTSTVKNIGIGVSVHFYFDDDEAYMPTMANSDMQLYAHAIRYSGYVWEGSAEFWIYVYVSITTALSLTATPSQVGFNETVTLSGRLTRIDLGSGIAGQVVKFSVEGVEKGSALTDVDGYFTSLPILPPQVNGVYTFWAVYGGNAPWMSASASRRLGLLIEDYTPLILLSGGLLALYYLSKKR